MKLVFHSIQAGVGLRLRWKMFVGSLMLVTICGCSGAPVFNILGSYFPSWLVCLAIATGLTFTTHALFVRTKLVQQLWPLPVVYPALVCLLSCVLWLAFFE